MTHARPDVSPGGEFRVPDDDLDVPALADTAGRHQSPEAAPDITSGTARWSSALRVSRQRLMRGRVAEPGPSAPSVDLARTPREVIAATALGVVAVPLLFVYAGLFIVRYFLQPGEQPDITSSWGGEGLSGLVALVLAIVLAVIVGRAVAGRGLVTFVVAELIVVAACGWLLSDSASGGAAVSTVVGAASLIAAVCALLPASRRWYAAHRAADVS